MGEKESFGVGKINRQHINFILRSRAICEAFKREEAYRQALSEIS